jgi:hypothetical protein
VSVNRQPEAHQTDSGNHKAKWDAATGYYRIEFELRVSGVEKMNELLDLFSGNKHIVSVEI